MENASGYFVSPVNEKIVMMLHVVKVLQVVLESRHRNVINDFEIEKINKIVKSRK